MRARLGLLCAALLAVVAVGTCSGCWGAPPPAGLRVAVPTTEPVGPADVVLFGDSLARFGQVPILAAWGTQMPGVSISYNAEPGAEGGANWLPWMSQVQADQCVIYALGTNETSRLTAEAAEMDTLSAFNELADADTVVVLSLNETSAKLRGEPFYSRARHFNAFLRQLYIAGTYPNLVLVSWRDVSLGHYEYLIPDNIHHTDLGTQAYGQTIIDAGSWC